jgi:hypothetical protein
LKKAAFLYKQQIWRLFPPQSTIQTEIIACAKDIPNALLARAAPLCEMIMLPSIYVASKERAAPATAEVEDTAVTPVNRAILGCFGAPVLMKICEMRNAS